MRGCGPPAPSRGDEDGHAPACRSQRTQAWTRSDAWSIGKWRSDESRATKARLPSHHSRAHGHAELAHAQLLQRTQGERAAADFVHAELARIKGPVALISRLNKRIDLLSLTGSPAPELEIEDFIGDRPQTLAGLRGKPVLLFVWAEWCADCKAQAPTLARIKARYAGKGPQVVVLTRYYEKGSDHSVEKARVDSAWKAVYADVGTVPLVMSTASMKRYGGSSTPTFVFVDRAGIVRRYTPTRLTEAEMDRTVTALLD